LNGEVTRQASAIAFLNDFWLMMVMTLAAIPLLLLLRPVKHAMAPAVVADH
jgi:DHA2 family multidrug resistance protein